MLLLVVLFFFFKQKTAYEMRISDWSSDVCSSDLIVIDDLRHRLGHARRALQVLQLSVLDRSGRTEMHQQRLLPCRADTRHFVQRACSHGLASLRTMGPDGETVRLVTQAQIGRAQV